MDGVTLNPGDRFLYVFPPLSSNQETGIRIFNGTGVAAPRATDANSGREFEQYREVQVLEGLNYANSVWAYTGSRDPSVNDLGGSLISFERRAAKLGTGIVGITDSTTSDGVSNAVAPVDHQHAHGNRGGGSLHAVATTSTAGFESAADKTKLNGQPEIFIGTLQTTTAVSQTLLQVPIPVGAHVIMYYLTAYAVGNSPSLVIRSKYPVRNNAGTVFKIGSNSELLSSDDSGGWAGGTPSIASYTVNGTNIDLVIAGTTGDTINWTVRAYLYSNTL
jgi:hypothetical protein